MARKLLLSSTLQASVTGKHLEAGVDEAGRGPLAGPVVAAAVVLPLGCELPGLNDSKKLDEDARLALRERIQHIAVAWALGIGTVADIARLNILNATFHAMHQAIETLEWTLGEPVHHIAIDGNRFAPYKGRPHSCHIKGDAQFQHIAAASILAKTYRDELMLRLHSDYPHYGWNHNKGYPTESHRAAIAQHGPSPHHRVGFRLLPPPSLF